MSVVLKIKEHIFYATYENKHARVTGKRKTQYAVPLDRVVNG